ncbi:hypothetical protein AGLY_015441 [Aphis glycines]|uniref:THAP-type domain-containing protein n=1 Tax=Aphis glycines TaxID=307491 RepID=A0A6G0T0N2_APHGL|nr:hypothetical protein AGLY_015441 [Aphis glycines]
MVQCWVPLCSHISNRENCKFFRFPADDVLRNNWAKAVRRSDAIPTKNTKICNCHFKEGLKINGPSIFSWNKNSHFNFASPEKFTKYAIISFCSFFQSGPMGRQKVLVETENDIDNDESVNTKLNCEIETVSMPNEEVASSNNVIIEKNQLIESLQSKNDSLKKEIIFLKNRSFGYHSVESNGKMFDFYCGITKVKFDLIIELVYKVEINYYYSWSVKKLCLNDQVLMALMKLRLNLCYTDLAFRFGLVGVAPNGVITYASKLYPGSTSDKKIQRSRRKRVEKAQQLPEQIETRNAAQRIRTAESRARESQEQRDEHLQQNITRTRAARKRNIATVRERDRQRQWISRSLTRVSFVRLAFEYAPDINYSAHSKIAIGGMNKVCQYCQALKFRNEAAGMCCASGKVVLSPLPAPPKPLLSLLTGNSDDSKLFLRKIRKFNSCFQMTSFGATKICDRASDGRNFETTFKIQGQVYYKIGSLMPMPDNNPKFLQIYFMGDCDERVTTRCLYNFFKQAEERAIVILLENFLEDHNQLIQLIKRVSPRLQNDNYQIVIKADKVPLGEHAGRFNAPTVDEVAVIMVGDPVDKRSIKITRRDNTYDPNTGDYRNNKVSSMNYYAHRIMVDNIKTIISFDIVSCSINTLLICMLRLKANACDSFDLTTKNYDRKNIFTYEMLLLETSMEI